MLCSFDLHEFSYHSSVTQNQFPNNTEWLHKVHTSLLAFQSLDHWVNHRCVSCSVTSHSTSKACQWLVTMHLSLSSWAVSRACSCVAFLFPSDKLNILQKWIIKWRNWPTKIKVQQINGKWQCWKWILNHTLVEL